MIRRQDVWPLGAIGFVLAVTAAWWGFALWAVPGAPDWVERARAVCFNLDEGGLPDTKGWLLLLGQPPTMLAFLLVGWRERVTASVGHLLASWGGRTLAGGILGLVLLGAGVAAARIADARPPRVSWGEGVAATLDPPRLDRAWPESEGLVDQTGATFTHARLHGRAAMVTFAFGHCETLCPVVVRQTLVARAEAVADTGSGDLSVVVVTLDPWRDTPSRLPALLDGWGLDPARDFVVGGPTGAVERALDAWGIARTRNLATGDIVHAGVVYLVESSGTVAYAATGGPAQLAELAARLPIEGSP